MVRLRPGLIFSRDAASEIRRLFAGPLLPGGLLRPSLIPVVPRMERLVFQALHSQDVARAYRLAVVGDASGAFNLAAEPVIDSVRLAELLGARGVPVSARLLRAAAAASFRLRLQPSEPGWLDMALAVPSWTPPGRATSSAGAPGGARSRRSPSCSRACAEGAGLDTPPLEPGGAGPLRLREFLSGRGSATLVELRITKQEKANEGIDLAGKAEVRVTRCPIR